MLSESVTNLSLDAFREAIAHKKIVLIYPTVSYRNIFLSYFLQLSEGQLLYYRLPFDNISLRDFLAHISDVLPVTKVPFSETVFSDYKGNDYGDAWGKGFATYLQSLPKQPTIIYLDEIDRTPQDTQFREFIDALVDHLPEHVQLVINARMLTYHPWIEYINSDTCAVLGTNLRKDSLMFTPKKDTKPQLEVYAFGQGIALVNGREITNWDGALPRQMFYFFMDNHLVTRDQIFQTFWPTLPVKEATNVFHVTKRKIGEQITRLVNDGGDHELTVYGAGFYTPNGKIERHYDVAEFEQSVNTAYMSEDENEQRTLYERAIYLYRGDFLLTLDMPWVVTRREKLRMLFVDSLIGMGRIYKQHQDNETALSYYIRALREVPLREDIHRDIMNLYIKLGRREDALVQYKTLVDLLQQSLKVTPSKDTRQLFEKISAS